VWLRKLQMKSAEEGSVPIQIMLGKQELKQGEDPAANEDRIIPPPLHRPDKKAADNDGGCAR